MRRLLSFHPYFGDKPPDSTAKGKSIPSIELRYEKITATGAPNDQEMIGEGGFRSLTELQAAV